MSNKYQNSMEFQDEISSDGKRTDASENKEEGDQLTMNLKVFYMPKSKTMTFAHKDKFDNRQKN
jgi:hypothetical protein